VAGRLHTEEVLTLLGAALDELDRSTVDTARLQDAIVSVARDAAQAAVVAGTAPADLGGARRQRRPRVATGFMPPITDGDGRCQVRSYTSRLPQAGGVTRTSAEAAHYG
jgi:hypothetical protein